MFHSITLFTLLFLICTNVHSEVIQLASKNISQYLQDHVTFVRFYANWCPHSKKLEPMWHRFADVKQINNLHIAEFDCSIEPLLCSDHDIFGYPTIKLFLRGSGARYEGPRAIESFESFYHEKIAEDANNEDMIVTKTAIIDLTTDNFAKIISKGYAFIMFYAPWCKHCKVLMPVFQELARQMLNKNDLILATVDCTAQNILCEKNSIQGYPTLIWFENGIENDRYQEARDLNSLKSYIEQKIKESKPELSEKPLNDHDHGHEQEQPQDNDQQSQFDNILTAKTFTQGVSFEGYAFVNFGAPWCSHCQKLAPVWNQLAQKFSQYEEIRILRVDCTASESLCRDYGIRAFPTLILFRYGESKVEYNGSRDVDSLATFLIGQLEVYGDDYLLKHDEELKND